MKKISKLDPQPDEWGIFATGATRINKLDENGYAIYDPDWDLKPFGPAVNGVWLAEPDGDDSGPFGQCVKQGRFVQAPDEIDFVSLMSGKAGPKKIKGEWWWVTE